MNYPVWDLPMGHGLLMAIISIVHVYIAHFAVGGGFFLILTEIKCYRENNLQLLEWLKKHTKFFVLLTVVFGAVTGVGIWFTIGLISPSATSSLIHAFVWGWAIEWVFFFLEITAALFYLYGWEKLSRKNHMLMGWIYFIAAFLSLFIINGIVSFMLTSGQWVETRNFWDGFFNPTYFPSLFIRSAFTLILAGVYALLTTGFQKGLSPETKEQVVKWTRWWILPAFLLLPLLVLWYINRISGHAAASMAGKMPTAAMYGTVIAIAAGVTFLLSLGTFIKPKKFPVVLAVLIFLGGFITMWAFEHIREAIRKPYVVDNFMYSNSIYKEEHRGDDGMNALSVSRKGVLKSAKWSLIKEVTPENRLEAGQELFRISCQDCHTTDSYRSVRKELEKNNWSPETLEHMLNYLQYMKNEVMPPFFGKPAEVKALAAYLGSLAPYTGSEATTGEKAFSRYCGSCHYPDKTAFAFMQTQTMTAEQIKKKIETLGTSPYMPPFTGSEEEKKLLSSWIEEKNREFFK